MKLNRFISAAAALLIGITGIGAYAEHSGFYNETELCSPAKTPSETKYTSVAWNTGEAESAGVPLVWGGTALLPVGNRLEAYSEKDGALEGAAALNDKVSKEYRGAVLGNTIVQPTKTGISVVNAQTMQVVSEKSFGEICSDVAVSDNLAYFAYSGEGYRFVCADLSDGLSTVWEYSSDLPLSSATGYNEYVVFAAGDKLVCADAKTGSAVVNELGFTVAGTPYAGQYAVYLSGADGNLYRLRLNDDGTIEDDTLTPCEIGGELTSPVMWNGRVYVSSTTGFYILDSLTLEVLKSYPEMAGGTAPIVCYGGGTHVYITAPLEDFWCLYSVYDMEEFDEPHIEKLAKLDNFEGGKTTVAPSGTMYFRDGSGHLYALVLIKYSVVLIILKLVLLLAILVMVLLLLRNLVKKRNANRPPQF